MTSATVSAAGACFPDPAAARPVAARITVHTPELAAVTQVADLALAHITVQPMPGGKFLVAGARAGGAATARTATGSSTTPTGRSSVNRYSATGSGMSWPPATGRSGSATSMREFTGNYGWGQDGTEEPVGAYGIVRFSPGLEPVWRYPKYTEVGLWDAG